LYPFSIYIIVGSFNRFDDLSASSSEGAYRCHFAGYEAKCFLCYKAEKLTFIVPSIVKKGNNARR
jgi:hypothetical protein